MRYASDPGVSYDEGPNAGVAEVAIVDVGPALAAPEELTDGGTAADPAAVARIAQELVAAFRHTGFAVIVGHRVSPALFDAMTEVSKEFFQLPMAEKLQVVMPSAEVIRGYEPPPEAADAPRTPNVMECMLINRLDELGDFPAGSAEATLWRWPNLWPERPERLRPVWEEYYRAMTDLGDRLLTLVAQGIGLSQDWFADKFDRHFNNLASNFYPPRVALDADAPLPNRPHTDHGALTLLYRPSEPGGLEVHAQGRWWQVPFVPGSLVINVGDILERWTGGLLRATPHRVVAAAGQAAANGRQSIVYFQQPNPDLVVTPAEPFRSREGAERYTDVQAGVLVSRKELGAPLVASLGVGVP